MHVHCVYPAISKMFFFLNCQIFWIRAESCLVLIVYSGVQHILSCFFFVFFFVWCTLYMLLVSLDCAFLIASLVFSNVYLQSVFYHVHPYTVILLMSKTSTWTSILWYFLVVYFQNISMDLPSLVFPNVFPNINISYYLIWLCQIKLITFIVN